MDAHLSHPACLCMQVPIAVQGRIVNWIDSKATFGDDKTHRCGALELRTHMRGPICFCSASDEMRFDALMPTPHSKIGTRFPPCRDQALGQYQKYVNRFGPGLVIYWHGFIRDLSQLEGGALADSVWHSSLVAAKAAGAAASSMLCC